MPHANGVGGHGDERRAASERQALSRDRRQDQAVSASIRQSANPRGTVRLGRSARPDGGTFRRRRPWDRREIVARQDLDLSLLLAKGHPDPSAIGEAAPGRTVSLQHRWWKRNAATTFAGWQARAAAFRGRSGAGTGDHLDAAPHSGLARPYMIAKPGQSYAPRVNKMSAAGACDAFRMAHQPHNAPRERHLCLSAPDIDQGSGGRDASGDRHFGRRAARADTTLKQDSTAKHCSGRS